MRSAGYKYQLQSTNPAIVEPPKHDREAIIDHREHKSPDKAKPGLSRKHHFSTPLEPVPLGHTIKASKKKDVESLLKLMYCDEWKNNTNLSWYKIILEKTPECHEIEGDEEECECDCLEPDVGLHI
ncbi:hypothetical protein J6590_106135 [Homalodisca vitripennis]|nr:hypothetical protein J6590_106135 [Homalodisca vitripennis]